MIFPSFLSGKWDVGIFVSNSRIELKCLSSPWSCTELLRVSLSSMVHPRAQHTSFSSHTRWIEGEIPDLPGELTEAGRIQEGYRCLPVPRFMGDFRSRVTSVRDICFRQHRQCRSSFTLSFHPFSLPPFPSTLSLPPLSSHPPLPSLSFLHFHVLSPPSTATSQASQPFFLYYTGQIQRKQTWLGV